MEIQTRLAAFSRHFIALVFLFISLTNFQMALSFDGVENNYIAENSGMSLIISLTVIFGVGWGVEKIIETLLVSKGRKIAILGMLIVLFVFILIEFISLWLLPRGFVQSAMSSNGYMFMSGFLFRFSVAQPKVIDELQFLS